MVLPQKKAPVDPLSQAPKPKSASGSQNRRGWTPNPVYVKAKQQRRSLFHDQKYQYQVWLKKKNYLDPRPDSNYDEVLIQCVADVLWNRRLAMILAIPLNHLPSLTIEERVTRWEDVFILVSVSAGETSLVGAIPPRTWKMSPTGSGIGLFSQEEYFFFMI